MSDKKKLTINAGCLVADNQNVLKCHARSRSVTSVTALRLIPLTASVSLIP
ncbi:hypothetical protein [Methylobacter svalbardensis]|uniref:hypothetical protein n=1 Tax=Methylobacter svalbardensis TaxID=3080016 RepID=UPI0030EF9B03